MQAIKQFEFPLRQWHIFNDIGSKRTIYVYEFGTKELLIKTFLFNHQQVKTRCLCLINNFLETPLPLPAISFVCS